MNNSLVQRMRKSQLIEDIWPRFRKISNNSNTFLQHLLQLSRNFA